MSVRHLGELGQPGHARPHVLGQTLPGGGDGGGAGQLRWMRPGLSETPSAQSLMVGYAVKDDARLPSTCWRAQSAGVLENGAGGQSRFFSASSSSVASTYPARAAP